MATHSSSILAWKISQEQRSWGHRSWDDWATALSLSEASRSRTHFLYFKKIIYLWLHRVLVAACSLSSLQSGPALQPQCAGFSLQWLLSCCEHGLCTPKPSSCSSSWAVARRLRSCGTGLAALRPVGFLHRPGLKPVLPGIGRQILYHWSHREAFRYTFWFGKYTNVMIS